MIKPILFMLFLNGFTGVTYVYINALFTKISVQEVNIDYLYQKIDQLEQQITQLEQQITQLQNQIKDLSYVTQYEVVESNL